MENTVLFQAIDTENNFSAVYEYGWWGKQKNSMKLSKFFLPVSLQWNYKTWLFGHFRCTNDAAADFFLACTGQNI